ncbi:MAG: endonuclease/exonuclease/phosphatase family protein [Acidimicrobiales bacterium]
MPDTPARTALTAVTWNLQGGLGLDVDAVVTHLRDDRADLIALQEVQRHQCRALADGLGPAWQWTWGFKHWPVVRQPEGVALLSRLPLRARRVIVLRPAWAVRSTRRVAVVADCHLGATSATPPPFRIRVASVHLSPDANDEAWRHRELGRVGAAAPDLVMGDLNMTALSRVGPVLDRHGWTDAAAATNGSAAHRAATHWSPGPRRGRAPDHRLDYVLAGTRLVAVSVSVPEDPIQRDRLAGISDHLPVTARVRPTPVRVGCRGGNEPPSGPAG